MSKNETKPETIEMKGSVKPGPDMNHKRSWHTSVLLSDGRIMVLGGENKEDFYTKTTEFFNPKTGEFEKGPDMMLGRSHPSVIMLSDKKRLFVVGGVNGCPLPSTEFFDLDKGCFVWGPCMSSGRAGHTLNLLPDGSVLIAGGEDEYDEPMHTEIFLPCKGIIVKGPRLKLHRAYHSSVTLPDKRVLFIGGVARYTNDYEHTTTEIYDPFTNTICQGPCSKKFPLFHSSTKLLNGLTMFSGGYERALYSRDQPKTFDCTEIYNPETGLFTRGPNMISKRSGHSSCTMADGRVLITGGSESRKSSEILSAL